MILLIIVYWDDVGGFSLYPLQDPKHEVLQPGCCVPMTTRPPQPASPSGAQTKSSFIVSTNTSSTPFIPKQADQKNREEGEAEQQHEQKREETRENEEKELPPYDREQEARKKRIEDVCSGNEDVEVPKRTRAFSQIPNRELDHLIVDDTHQIIYCYVPKVLLLLPGVCCICVGCSVHRAGKSVHCVWRLNMGRKNKRRSTCLNHTASLFFIVDQILYGPCCLLNVFPFPPSSAADLSLGSVHQLEESDGGSVSVSDLTLLGDTLH